MDSVEQYVEYRTFNKRNEILWSCEFGEKIKSVKCWASGVDLFDFLCPNYEDVYLTYRDSKVSLIGNSRVRKRDIIKIKVQVKLDKLTIERWISLIMS